MEHASACSCSSNPQCCGVWQGALPAARCCNLCGMVMLASGPYANSFQIQKPKTKPRNKTKARPHSSSFPLSLSLCFSLSLECLSSVYLCARFVSFCNLPARCFCLPTHTERQRSRERESDSIVHNRSLVHLVPKSLVGRPLSARVRSISCHCLQAATCAGIKG